MLGAQFEASRGRVCADQGSWQLHGQEGVGENREGSLPYPHSHQSLFLAPLLPPPPANQPTPSLPPTRLTLIGIWHQQISGELGSLWDLRGLAGSGVASPWRVAYRWGRAKGLRVAQCLAGEGCS